MVLKLLPIVINLRHDRREWVKREGKNVNEEKYRRHARKVLKTFIELGPSYVKLGQWLSTRVDILPQPYLEVLSKLQDDVPPALFSEVKTIIESELGKIEDAFEEFDTSPLSGASLGQVYLARYAGEQVIVKVGRPNIERIIEDDIYVLKKILPLATRFIDPNLRFSAEGMLAQFIETVHEEMDYRIEAENLLTIKSNLAGDPSVIIPDVFLDRTTRHVLTMKYVPGVKITDIARLDEKEIDREKLVVRVHRLFFKMLLRYNIFHADPHPGNISVADDGRLILYDFGMVGRLDSETRIRLIRLYLVDNMDVKALVELANKTMSRFPFRLPKNLALYMRMSSILEGIYHHHKVPFKFVKVLAGLLEEEGLVRDAYIEEVKVSAKRFAKGIQDSVSVAPMLKTYLETMSPYSRQEKNNSALAASIFASALFIGSALMLPYNFYLAYGGFVAAAATVAMALKKKI